MSSSRHVQSIKHLDNLLGRLAVLLIPAPCHSPPSPIPSELLIIRPGGIGDAVLLIPAIRILKETYPDIKITILAEKRNSAVFSLCPEIACVRLYDRPRELIAAVRGKYDVVIDTEQWHRLSAVIARMIKSSVKIGYGTNERKRLFTHYIPYSHNDYETESFFNLLSPLGIEQPQEPDYPFLQIPANIVSNVKTILNPLSGKDFIALFPGASILEKRWSDDKFVTLTGKLNEKGFAVVILGADSEKRVGDKAIAGRCGLNLAGRTSLLESAAVIRESRMLISGDSGLLHIAAGLEVPTVSLFGPSNISKWAPRGGCHIVVSSKQPCSPCSKFGYTPRCPINTKCMVDITVEHVVMAVEKLIMKY